MQRRLYTVCKDYGSVFTHTIEHDDEPMETIDKYPVLPEIVRQYNQATPNAPDELLLKHLRDVHTDDYLQSVETITADDENQETWLQYRKGRITASVMGSVTRCRMDQLDNDNYISRQIMGVSTLSYSLPATEYGKTMEKVALAQYSLKYDNEHTNSEISKCGLFISKEYPFIGATPDGVVKCSCCGEGIIEVKCSYAYQHLSPDEVATQCDKYNLCLEDGSVKLKKDTKWYTQIQTQLGVTKKSWCDFVFFTRKGLSVERIEFDSEYFKHCQSKAKAFFFKFLKDKLY